MVVFSSGNGKAPKISKIGQCDIFVTIGRYGLNIFCSIIKKIAVQKNHLGVKFCREVWALLKKIGVNPFLPWRCVKMGFCGLIGKIYSATKQPSFF